MFDVIQYPHPVLKEKSSVIETIDNDIINQAKNMVDAMYKDSGIGLAANQVAIANRLFVMDVPDGVWRYDGEKKGVLKIEAGYRSGERAEDIQANPKIVINPEIVKKSEARSVYEEGCLSLPGHYAEVVRPAKITARYRTLNGETIEEEFEGLDSHCFQHELDHLDGVLFIDHISALKRNMIVKRMKKAAKGATL